MENSSWALLALAYIVAMAFISKIIFKRYPKRKLPLGPKPWPIIGNLNLLGSIPHQSLHLLLSQKYGEIMQLKFGKFPVVVASSPEMAKQFLKVHDTIFASRPALSAGKYIGYNYQDMTWAPYGPYWRQARKIFHNEVFNANKFELHEHIREGERRNFFSHLYSLTGKPVVIRDHLSRYTLSSISSVIMSTKYFYQSENEKANLDMDELREMMDEWLFLAGVFTIGDWIPWLSIFDLQGYIKRMKVVHKKMDNFYNYVIDDHLAERSEKENSAKDVLDAMLELSEDPNIEVKLTKDCVKGLLQRHGKRCEHWIGDCNVAGYDISKGTTVLINTWSIGRDLNSWDAPEEFVPERFLDKEIDLGSTFALLPFGSGRRRCPGFNLGLKIVRTTFANLVHGFDMKLVEGMMPNEVCMDEVYGLITHPKKPLAMVLEPTLPSYLY